MLPADGPPLDPSAAHAHRLLARELSKAAYHEQQSLLVRAIEWLQDRLQHLLNGSAGKLPPVLLVVIVLAVVAVVALTVPRLRRSARMKRAADAGGVLAGEVASAEALRERARLALDDGRYRDALTDYYRALARSGEERALLRIGPGSTAHEIALQLRTLFPAEAGAVQEAAIAFDRVCYGGVDADRSAADAMRGLDERLLRLRPTHDDRLVSP